MYIYIVETLVHVMYKKLQLKPSSTHICIDTVLSNNIHICNTYVMFQGCCFTLKFALLAIIYMGHVNLCAAVPETCICVNR